MEKKQIYLDQLAKLLSELYTIIHEIRSDPQELPGYVSGFMKAGRIFGVSYNELESVINKEREKFQSNALENLEIPTFIREKMKKQIKH